MARKSIPFEAFLVCIGNNIRRVRTGKGYTLDELGHDIGLDKSNLHHIEQGKNITVLTLLKIAAFLEVTPASLLESDITITAEEAEQYIKGKKKA